MVTLTLHTNRKDEYYTPKACGVKDVIFSILRQFTTKNLSKFWMPKHGDLDLTFTNIPEGWVFRSKNPFNTSSACGVNDVRRFRFLDGSLPMNSVKFWTPFLYRSSASSIHLSKTGFIFCALFGVMSNFSNLQERRL